MPTWMILYWSDKQSSSRSSEAFHTVVMCVCAHTYTYTHTQVETRVAHKCRAARPSEHTCREADELCTGPAERLHLHSLITALQKLPLRPRVCLQWRWCSGSFWNHCLHLRLLRKCSCHTSWNHVVQSWTGPNCRWWFWGAEIGYN